MKRILVLTEVELPSDFPGGQIEHYLGDLARVEMRMTDFEGLKSQFRDVRRGGQIRADALLDYLEPRVRGGYEGFDKIVLVINDDGYVEGGLNFVFGVAKIGGALALVFTKRLRGGEQSLYHLRILKEVLHELGHSFGLDHCTDPKCVMYFSNTIEDTDRKGPGYCQRCMARLRSLLR
ncbi:archaemetzincin family Zn-dependent metalloprotease [Vulcanisaeta distributa]|uniref:archaemetzincin family Zn-dependent metalloprotease n=1 Tax=Vulcanisaeta distributa TaxID=164451 RepID=UPI0006CFA8FB|nr:archaemetzincin family Zn-dependent metalloprotease [Vulcanisaeta distributa]